MTTTMTLTITVPLIESDRPIEMYASDDGDEFFDNNVLKEDAGFDVEFIEPYVTAKETLWLVPGIDYIVKNVLKRMEKSFAYNSVYFLKVILDLQVTYLGLNSSPPPDTLLDTSLVLRIAELMAGRMARKDKDSTSPSRELQLRTLVSALSLLYQVRIEKIENETYAKLLKDISERDADNRARFEAGEDDERPNSGDIGFLVRYACDLIRCFPSDIPSFNDLNKPTIHFLFAAGFINQLDGETTPEDLDNIFARIKAPPSEWHKDMRHLYEGTAGAISLQHQAQSRNPTRACQYAGILAADISRSIVERAEQELLALTSQDEIISEPITAPAGVLPKHEAHLMISGLLDLLNQLVSAFPDSEEIVEQAKGLSMKIIQTSDRPAFRYKAFEIIISATIGYTEAEYFGVMRDLDLVIDQYFGVISGPVASDEGNLRIEELKIEKRETMDRCAEKNVLYKGAIESMQRRIEALQPGTRSATTPSYRNTNNIDQVMRSSTWGPMDDNARSTTTASPVPSSIPSQAPTLSSIAPTCDSNPSPTETCTLLSPTDTSRSVLSPISRLQNSDSPVESPILPHRSKPLRLPQGSSLANAPVTPQEAITPNFDATLRFDHLDQLFTESLFEEPQDYPEDANVSRLSIDLPIQAFDDRKSALSQPVYIRREEQSSDSEEYQFRKDSHDSLHTRAPATDFSQILEAHQQSPLSIYPEPSLSRTASGMGRLGDRVSNIFSRRSLMGRPTTRLSSLQLNKPLPPLDTSEDAPEPVDPNAPPVIVESARSQSALEVRREKQDFMRGRSNSALGHGRSNSYEPRMMPIFSGVETVPIRAWDTIEYESQPYEEIFKVAPKDNCFSVFMSADARYAVYMSPHGFQVFTIPKPGETSSTKPRFTYKLGEAEGLRKGKVTWGSYKGGAASEKYVVTVTGKRVQVHDLEQECKVVFTEDINAWEFSCVAIEADKLVAGLSKSLMGESVGMVRIFRVNAPTYSGLRCEKLRDVHLPINPRSPRDAPHVLSISKDGGTLTCATPKHGYYYSWNIAKARIEEPTLINSGRLKVTEGYGSEMISSAALFPDSKHILVSTFPTSPNEGEWNGSFTEPVGTAFGKPQSRPIRQVSLRVTSTAIAPLGNAAAFLTKGGTIWTAPVSYVEGDENLTTFAPSITKEKLQNQQMPESAGRMMFTPEGDRLVAVDRKGKILSLTFRKAGLSPVLAPPMKLDVGGYF